VDWVLCSSFDLRADVAAVGAVYSEQAPDRDIGGLLAEWAAWARAEAARIDPVAARQ
jgi:hypothetical protein